MVFDPLPYEGYLAAELADHGFDAGVRDIDKFGDDASRAVVTYRLRNIEVAVNEQDGDVTLRVYGEDDPTYEHGYDQATFQPMIYPQVILSAITAATATSADHGHLARADSMAAHRASLTAA
ncbi:hypothetical protein [Planomonospora sp. ID82291]|uniref:hypothetical protein n=1 Tax=Planomonospora sp. ID82291 TaxID=2738136 RepID=UPI0018C44907|nr:hypothetical protein [Planomonospora sp. ID82291]MBG0818259.1 hypothetical protein [Planomonospora sp. ID82291]